MPGTTATDRGYPGYRADDFRYASRLRSVDLPILAGDPEPVMSTPPTIGALTSTTSLTGTIRRWAPVSLSSGVYAYASDTHTTLYGAAQPVISTTSGPGTNYVRYASMSNPTSTGGPTFAHWNHAFWHNGSQLEIRILQGSGLSVRVWVNGQLVQAAPITFSAGSNIDGYVLLTFASRANRRIEIEAVGGTWGGVVTPIADNITPAAVRGPLVLIVADSFGEGANGVGAHSSFIRRFARRTGWHRTISSAVGGTGYLNTGAAGSGRTNVRPRLAADVYPFNPDIVIWTVGGNDIASFTASATGTEAAACFAAVAANLPKTKQIVCSPIIGSGPRNWGSGSNVIPTRDAIQAAAVAAGLPFLDALQPAIPGGAISGTIQSTAGLNSTTINLGSTIIPVGSTVNIGGVGVEYNVITGVSGAAGSFNHTLQFGLKAVRNAGTVVTQVGEALLTGTGTSAAPTGDGNSDFLVGSDAVHPTKEGQDVFGDWLAAAVARTVLAGI